MMPLGLDTFCQAGHLMELYDTNQPLQPHLALFVRCQHEQSSYHIIETSFISSKRTQLKYNTKK
jgi:hypothetical protein